MVYSLKYRRPKHVESSHASVQTEKSDKAESFGSGSSCSYGIPDALSFERIITGATCPPCTTREFMDFLLYIEHAAENLQFYLWYQDYIKRFDQVPEEERKLSPIWTTEQAEAEALATQKEHLPKKVTPEVASVLKGTDFDPKAKPILTETGVNPFYTPPRTPNGERSSTSASTMGWSEDSSTVNSGAVSHTKKAAAAFEAADAHQPFTVQPFREEISRVIAIYIADGGSRQLNLSSKERSALLKALSQTTHPSAFRNVVATVEWSLRHQAHPNFIRWTICNGNRPRVVFARGLGIAGIIGGLVCAIILCLSSANRGWRVLSGLGFFIGIATLFAAWKGMCVVLHGMHHRHLRPWELFADADEVDIVYESKKNSFDSFGSANSYESEPWVVKYEKRNIIRRIFDRELWIQEPALRQIQDTIFIQALLTALMLSIIIVGIFCAFPKGNFF